MSRWNSRVVDYEFDVAEDGSWRDVGYICSDWHADAQMAENEALVRCGATLVTEGNEDWVVDGEAFDVKRVDGMHQYRIRVSRPYVHDEDYTEEEDG